jgi:ferredoxin
LTLSQLATASVAPSRSSCPASGTRSRGGLAPPFSREAGNCATCTAQVTKGEARMRVDNALEDDEVTDGWILTCQGIPVTPHVTVVYED